MEDCQHILNALGAFDYVAANKLIPRITKVYQPIGSIFTRLSSTESSFSQLAFLRSRWFVMRKDTSVEVVYTNLASELPKEMVNILSTTTLSKDMKNYLVVVMEALTHLCHIRRDMINLYQSILAQSTRGEFDVILKEMESVQAKTMSFDLQKDLLLLGLGVEKEINILTCLLRARMAITNYAFQDTCIDLFQSKQDLSDWKRVCQEQDYPEKTYHNKPDDQSFVKETSSIWPFSFFGSSSSGNSNSGHLETTKHANNKQQQGELWPNTIRWHTRVLGNLTAKMTLYFNTILLEKEIMVTDEDPQKSLWKGLRIDYYDQISTFKKKFGAYSISLVYQVTNDTPFYPQGYTIPTASYEPPQGIHSFPFIYCHPRSHPPNKHLPNIISIIQSSKHKLSDYKAGIPVHFFDATMSSTYYIMRIDHHVVMCIIYLDKQHAHREPNTLEWMANIVTLLRGSTVIEELIRVDY